MTDALITFPPEEEVGKRLLRQNSSSVVANWHATLMAFLGGESFTVDGTVYAFAVTITQEFAGHVLFGPTMNAVPSYIDALVDDVNMREAVKERWHKRLEGAGIARHNGAES